MEKCSEDSGSEVKAESDVVSAQASSSSPQDSSFLPSPDDLLPPTLRPRLKYNKQLQLMPSSNQCPSTESASENSDDAKVLIDAAELLSNTYYPISIEKSKSSPFINLFDTANSILSSPSVLSLRKPQDKSTPRKFDLDYTEESSPHSPRTPRYVSV
jgi:hypothetical protein